MIMDTKNDTTTPKSDERAATSALSASPGYQLFRLVCLFPLFCLTCKNWDETFGEWDSRNFGDRRTRKAQRKGMLYAAKVRARDKARIEELEKALDDISRRCPTMGSTGEYREGQLHALQFCKERAIEVLSDNSKD